MWRLERALAEICGLPHVSLQSAGSHGSFRRAPALDAGAYHEGRGAATQGAPTPPR